MFGRVYTTRLMFKPAASCNTALVWSHRSSLACVLCVFYTPSTVKSSSIALTRPCRHADRFERIPPHASYLQTSWIDSGTIM
ncbi:hypothetical protein ABKN59_004918 [Abortiporus biennis]